MRIFPQSRKSAIIVALAMIVVVSTNVLYWNDVLVLWDPFKPTPCVMMLRPWDGAATPIESSELHNLYNLNWKMYSGSGPETEEGFRELQKLYITTIISVDGATPDVATAEKYGIRYMHIPVGYDGISNETAYKLARAVQTSPGSVYIHCHHGKHRGPAAAAAIELCLNPDFTPEQAETWLKLAGTDPKYRGLINLPRTLVRPSAEELNRIPADFPKAATVPDLTRHMVGIDERWDHLKLVKAAGWKTPPSHPDVDPAHEALQLKENYREATRLTASSKKGEAFLTMMIEAEASASELEKHLRTKPIPADAAAKAFARNQALCASCHERFRD